MQSNKIFTGSPEDDSSRIVCQDEAFRRYITETRIKRRLGVIGRTIDDQYRDSTPILVGILNGSYIVLADLMRELSIACEVDFMKLSSYGARKVSSGNVTQLKRIDADLTDRHVIIVEDIVDTGLSMEYVADRIREKDPRSVRLFTLLLKPDALEHDVPIDYIGFTIPDRFVIGYGLDYGQIGRNLRHVYIRADEHDVVLPAEEPQLTRERLEELSTPGD